MCRARLSLFLFLLFHLAGKGLDTSPLSLSCLIKYDNYHIKSYVFFLVAFEWVEPKNATVSK